MILTSMPGRQRPTFVDVNNPISRRTSARRRGAHVFDQRRLIFNSGQFLPLITE